MNWENYTNVVPRLPHLDDWEMAELTVGLRHKCLTREEDAYKRLRLAQFELIGAERWYEDVEREKCGP